MLRNKNRSRDLRSSRRFRPEIDAQLRLENRSLAAPTLLHHHLGLDPDTANMPMALPLILTQTTGTLTGAASLAGTNASPMTVGTSVDPRNPPPGPITAGSSYTADFYRYPEGTEAEAGDKVTSQATTTGEIWTSTTTSPAEFSSSASMTAGNGPQQTATASVTGMTSGTAVDVADPDPPNSPVGVASISMDTTSQIQYQGFPGFLEEDLNSTGYRSYQIAVSPGHSVSGWSVSETYTISLYNAPPPSVLNPMYAGMRADLITPTLAIAVKGTDVINTVVIDGVGVKSTQGGSPGGMVAPDGAIITYTWGPTSVNISATTPLSDVGVANTNPVSGFSWPVSEAGQVMLVGAADGTGSVQLQSNLNTHYGASIQQ